MVRYGKDLDGRARDGRLTRHDCPCDLGTLCDRLYGYGHAAPDQYRQYCEETFQKQPFGLTVQRLERYKTEHAQLPSKHAQSFGCTAMLAIARTAFALPPFCVRPSVGRRFG